MKFLQLWTQKSKEKNVVYLLLNSENGIRSSVIWLIYLTSSILCDNTGLPLIPIDPETLFVSHQSQRQRIQCILSLPLMTASHTHTHSTESHTHSHFIKTSDAILGYRLPSRWPRADRWTQRLICLAGETCSESFYSQATLRPPQDH